MKNAVFWDVTPCGSILPLLVTANVVSSSFSLSTLMMEAQRSSETSGLTRAPRRNIPEDGILEECVDLYIDSPIHLHGLVLSYAQGQLYLYCKR
jgi:hypothetical protein